MYADLSLGGIIGGGSALAFVVFGLYLVSRRPSGLGPRLVGPLAIGFGAQQVMFNLFPFSDERNQAAAPAIFWTNVAWLLLVLACASVLTVRLAEFGARRATAGRPWRALWVAGLSIILGFIALPSAYRDSLVGTSDISIEERAWKFAFDVAMASLAVLSLACAWAWRNADRRGRPRLLGLGVPFGLYVAWYGGRSAAILFDGLGDVLTGALLLVVGLSLIGSWLVAAILDGAASAWWAAAAMLIANVFGWLTDVFPEDPLGFAGIVRIAGVALLAYAFFRWELLGERPRERAVRTGTAVTFSAAAFLAVAQVLQNLVSDQAGLFWGALAAAIMIMATRPLERIATRHEPRSQEALASYRSAVRLVLRDRVLTPAEKEELAKLAHTLRLEPGDAALILNDERRRQRRRPAKA